VLLSTFQRVRLSGKSQTFGQYRKELYLKSKFFLLFRDRAGRRYLET